MKTWRLLQQKRHAVTATLLFFFIVFVAAITFCLWFNYTREYFVDNSSTEISETNISVQHSTPELTTSETNQDPPPKIENHSKVDVSFEHSRPQTNEDPPIRIENPSKVPKFSSILAKNSLNCNFTNNRIQIICPSTQNLTTIPPSNDQTTPTCPNYFKWIHQDLKPWSETGITREMVERAKKTAHFRLIVVSGKVYIKKYRKSIQTRDAFSVWGMLQLLRKYPGMLPDLDIMFDCDDRPVIRSMRKKTTMNVTWSPPPPLFRYCGDKWTADIVFPDWSFWGWAEINVKPWHILLEEISKGNRKLKWIDREPYAYWKGNPFVDVNRQDLLKCNLSGEHDWNARIFIQDWIREGQIGFKHSSLADQCTHRYKIYIEGYAWSVSEKYILACDSVTLMVNPHYYDFFTRSLQPVHHYWPIREHDKCKSIKFAVDWGNNHKQKAQEIGKAASNFLREEVKMDYVYDYMFHLLNEYGKLLRYKPKVPKGAIELCSESMVCTDHDGPQKKFMMDSLVDGPSFTSPCSLSSPFRPRELYDLVRRKLNAIKQVEKWEDNYWQNISNR